MKRSKGSLVWTKQGWAARVYTIVDGERVRKQTLLGTTNRAAAQAKLGRLLAGGAGAERAKSTETFGEAVARVHALRAAEVGSAKDELSSLKRYAFPQLGHMEVTSVTPADVNAALDYCKAQGKSRQTVVHLRQGIRAVFEQVQREGTRPDNPTDDSTIPRFPKTLQKERAVLTDHELAVYLAYQHPLRQHQRPVLQRQTMACVARCFGGLRTGDLHSLDWSAFDVALGAFEWGWAPRRKTKRPQLLEVPEMLRPILRDWWERHGRPTQGPMFPALRGKRAAAAAASAATVAKGKVSHARAFRMDLRRAFGVDAWDLGAGEFKTVRELTSRERELFEETAFTLPVDFHSWRRAFSQALADADVSAQKATALAGHASLAAHARYLASSGKLRKVPAAALPRLESRPLHSAVVRSPTIIKEMTMHMKAAQKTPDGDRRRPFLSTYKPDVIGSIPVPPTNNSEGLALHFEASIRNSAVGNGRVVDGLLADAVLAHAMRLMADSVARGLGGVQ